MDAGDEPQTPQDLTAFVQTLLQDMQGRFSGMSHNIVSRIDEMSSRVDALEKSINELMAQAGIEEEMDKKAAGAKSSE